ncbi:centromere-associated protein E-like [Hyla sarda]|uniref:centromere-associated protein E-like n=1 Tax=Hyla sarda TaxID=327740 RepID=UPI0024C36970|nr:centromere-associated protein E-like [Hyla sarda]
MSYRTSTKAVVGITSRCSDQDVQWLMEFIKGTFWEVVADVRFLPITNRNTLEWEERVCRCSVGILYHTKRHGRLNIVDIDGALYDEELRSLYRILGKSKVLVVLDDVEDCSDRERWRVLETQPSLRDLSSQLLLFTEKGKKEEALKKMTEFLKAFGYNTVARDLKTNTNNSTEIKNMVKSEDQSRWSVLKSILPSLKSEKSGETSSGSIQNLNQKQIQPKNSHHVTKRLKINVFSRSAQSNYVWLVDRLRTLDRSIDVHGVYITNSYTGFYQEISQCSFAILYHTQKQGRLNITDVTDSLYNEELKDLSKCLGKENVIVVVDDLKKADQSEKRRILEGQPSITRLAWDLYLFSEKKENNDNFEEIKKIIWKKIPTWDNMDTDYSQDDFDRKSTKSAKPGTSLGQEHPQNREDDHPPPPGTSFTAYSKERDVSSARDITWKSDHDSGEPEVKKMSLDLTRLNLQSPEAAAQVDNTFEDAYAKWKNLKKIMKADHTKMEVEIQRLHQENKELQSKNRSLLNKMSENENVQQKILKEKKRTIEKKQHDIETLHKDLQGKERTLKEKDEVIQQNGQTIQELKKRLREKEEQLTNEIKNIKEKQLTIETLHKDLQGQDRTLKEKDEVIQENGQTIQELKKRLREKEEQLTNEIKNIKEKQLTIETLHKDLQGKERTLKEKDEVIQENGQTIQELKKRLREKEEQLTNEIKNIKEKQLTIETLHKDLQGKERTLKEKDEVIQENGQTIQELKKRLREKEEQLTNEIKNIKEKQLTIETIHKDLQGQDRTIKEKNTAFEKMKQEIQQLRKYIQNMENRSRQEHDGHNWKQGIQAGESQRCEERSPIPRQENEHEHGGQDFQKGFNSMEEGSLQHRTHSNTGAMCNSWKNATEKLSLTPENDQIEQMKCTIEQQDEEIQKLETKIKQQMSTLEGNALLINDLLNVIHGGKEKC